LFILVKDLLSNSCVFVGAMENTDLFDWRAEKATFGYVKTLDKLWRDLQKIERALLLLLKERRADLEKSYTWK